MGLVLCIVCIVYYIVYCLLYYVLCIMLHERVQVHDEMSAVNPRRMKGDKSIQSSVYIDKSIRIAVQIKSRVSRINPIAFVNVAYRGVI